jgi:hypothetical protein
MGELALPELTPSPKGVFLIRADLGVSWGRGSHQEAFPRIGGEEVLSQEVGWEGSSERTSCALCLIWFLMKPQTRSLGLNMCQKQTQECLQSKSHRERASGPFREDVR